MVGPVRVHATAVALDSAGGALCVLLRGPSGSGKSDLALRLVDGGRWRLVADDQCEIERRGALVWARAPEALAGRMEVRGIGLVDQSRIEAAPIVLLVDLVSPEAVERMPEVDEEMLLETTLPRLALHPFEHSAPAKLALAAEAAATAILPRAGESKSDPAADSGVEADRKKSGAAPRRVLLVTGMSGAGRSTALNAFEDHGFEAINNLPLELLETVLEGGARPLALGIDIRARDFAVGPFIAAIDRVMEDPRYRVTLIFVDCDDEVLLRRYSATRRPHPLAEGRPLIDGIHAERRLVAPLRERADLLFDSSTLSPGDFRQLLVGELGLESAGGLAVFVTSFSYRGGLPREADLVFDVRFLANPHYREDLRPLSGRDPEVARYIMSDPAFGPFFAKLVEMLRPLLPCYEREGKSYLTIAIGCTGGRHRSVAVAERLAARLAEEGRSVRLVHRDLGEGAAADRGAGPGAAGG